ncbi:ROK family protein [Oceaniglobus trochenteri]|uniref:ROK family protein n=1 Tax=Oceaniglobus trochenteri TaxID=2763260 RepID=UPI001CFFFE5A|nr:ROK family protein [Oceaniglobus trochenteri]
MTAIGNILSLLRDTEGLSRADIVRATGLSSAATTKITAQILAEGYARETRAEDFTGIGRPPVTISLCPDARLVCGIHLSAGKVAIALTNLRLEPVAETRFGFDTASSPDEVIERTVAAANDLFERNGTLRQDIVGVGVGVPGRVDAAQRINTHAVATGWYDVPFADRFEAAFDLPVALQHNATAIALAETWFGAGRTAESTLHVFMGRGTGGGLAYASRALAPARIGGPIELGHIVIDQNGASCACGGRGCLETVFAERPLLKALGLDEVPPEGLIAAAMRTPEWDGIYDAFLRALATTVTLIAPEAVVLGGHLEVAPPEFTDRLRQDLGGRIMQQQRVGLTIGPTLLGPGVGVRGAACVGLDRFFYAAGPSRQRPAHHRVTT